MKSSVSRRQFLTANFHRKSALRPPWACAETRFIDACDRCGSCISSCPQKVLIKASGGFPEIDFNLGACTFCGRCVEACETAALARDEVSTSPWALTLTISGACLATNGIDCRVCGEQCEVSAIRFRPVLRSVPRPHVSVDQCTGCGACVGPCPSGAINLSVNDRQGTQQQ